MLLNKLRLTYCILNLHLNSNRGFPYPLSSKAILLASSEICELLALLLRLEGGSFSSRLVLESLIALSSFFTSDSCCFIKTNAPDMYTMLNTRKATVIKYIMQRVRSCRTHFKEPKVLSDFLSIEPPEKKKSD